MTPSTRPPRPPAPVQAPLDMTALLRRLQRMNETANNLLHQLNRRTLP